MYRLILLLALFTGGVFLPPNFGTCVRAQTVLTGTITDQATGEPLPFASIYVAETQTGTASNGDGEYYVRLASGANTVVFQYLGYETQTKTISGTLRLDVKLNTQSLNLETVEILSGGEDVSYSVMRRAIAKADYHLNQVERYRADVYVKGTGKVKKVGGAVRLLAGKEGREEIGKSLGRPFTTESLSTVHYQRPNTYRQEVKQTYSVGEEQFDAAEYIFTTFYQPVIAESVVSPLHPKAFGYYKFEQLGTFIDRDELINKIRVTPRSPGEDVVSGTINIVQDDWSIHSLDLTSPKLGFDFHVTQNYAEIQEHIWMPITTTLDIVGGIMGVEFEYHYVSTIGDYELTLNPALRGYVEVIDEKSQPEAAARTTRKRSVSELERALGSGEAVTRKDLRRLMKSYEKADRAQRDEPEVVSNYAFVDTAAVTVRDSAAWATLRPIPLTAEEIKGYEIADSVVVAQRQERIEAGIEVPTDTLEVKKFKAFRRRGVDVLPIFNPVQGYVAGARGRWGNQLKKFGFEVQPSYGFGNKKGYLELGAYLGWSRERRSFGQEHAPRYRLTGGQGVRQFNASPSISPWVSTSYNLLRGQNFIRLYEREFVQLDYDRHYGEAFRVQASVAYENRRNLRNTSNSNWLGLEGEESYAANIPVNAAVGQVLNVNDAATVELGVTWQPGLAYRIINERKEPIADSAPAIGFRVRQGIPNVGNTRSDFTELRASYLNRFEVGRKGKVQFLARAGYFLNNKFVDFPDFRHFEGSEISIVAADPLHSYRLLPYYAESTDEEYLEVYAHYQFRKFLLTQVTALNLLGLREDLFANYLHTPTSDNYTELGYSLDGIFRVFRLEFVTSFRDGRYDDFGVRVGVATTLAGL